MDAPNPEKLAKYEGWIRDLEARQKALAGQRSFYLRTFVALAVGSAAGFFVHPWIGAACLFTGVLMCLFGFYVVLVREGEYTRELELARRDAEAMRDAMGASNRQSNAS